MMVHEEHVADEETVEAAPPKRLRFAAIEFSNKTFDSMVLREPTVGALIAMRKKSDPIEQIMVLIQIVTGLPLPVVNQLPQAVMEAASKYFEGFSPPSKPAGTG